MLNIAAESSALRARLDEEAIRKWAMYESGMNERA
jgi:hypothetical protein